MSNDHFRRRERTFAVIPEACITEGHETRPVYSRGVCRTCYETLRNAIRSGETTDEALVAAGRWKAKQETLKDRLLDGVKP